MGKINNELRADLQNMFGNRVTFRKLERKLYGHDIAAVPGLIKVQVKQKPATKARKGINPFTGEETTFKAKPARRVVKVTPLKKLKEMAE